jgi:hypothetical protein
MGQYLEIIRKALAEIEAERFWTAAAPSQVDDTLVHLSAFPEKSIIAIQLWSYVLDAPVWVVLDDLPEGDWPKDAPVYRLSEVRILTAVGHNTLAWVHPVKEMFGGRVVQGYLRHRPPEEHT